MAPHRVAQERDRDQAGDEHARTQQRLAREYRQDLRDDPESRQNRDVHLRVPEEPEQMLPQQRGPARMRLQAIADHEAGGNEEARARDPVEDQQDARRHQDRERDEPDDGGDEPRPRGEGKTRERHTFGPQVERGRDEIEGPEQLRDAEHRDGHGPQRLPHPLPRPRVLADAPRGPYGVHPDRGGPSPTKNAESSTSNASSVTQNDVMLIRGNAMSSAPSWIGRKKLPKPANGAVVSTKNTMIVPCIVISAR